MQLETLLKKHFRSVDVRYAIKTGKYRWWGLQSYSAAKPHLIIRSFAGNLISRIESKGLDRQPRRTAHLIAVAAK